MTPRYSPAELSSALGLFAPTDEQAAVIAAPPGPLVVIAGAEYGAGSQNGVAPVTISAMSRPLAGPSVKPQWA